MTLRKIDNPFEPLDDAGELLVKHEAVELIESEMRRRGLTQTDLARRAGLKQPHISDMLRRRLDRFGVDRLNRVLAVFGARIGFRLIRSRRAA